MQELAVNTARAPHRPDVVLERMKENIWAGWIEISEHSRVRMAERGANLFDFFKTIQTGEILESHWDARHRNLRYWIKGVDTRGEERIVIAAMGQAKTVHFVTVFA